MPKPTYVLPRDAETALSKHGATQLRPYAGEQRHLSLRVETSRDATLWLKINVSQDLASVGREAVVLEALGSVTSVPRRIDSGSDGSWLLMTSLDGTPLSELPHPAQAKALPAVAVWLDDFRACAEHLPGFEVADEDLFGRSCQLATLLEPALRWWQEDINQPLDFDALLYRIRSTSPAIGPVQGSFDTQNIIIATDGSAGAVDFEAARPGLTSYDTATLLASLIGCDEFLATRWWEVAVGGASSPEAAFVLGHLLLRTWYMSFAGVLRREFIDRVVSFLANVSGLIAHRN